ncbi:hypothetical protein CVIRNUC_000365 [Coccomyxa viridis]|uniref:FHA domain-containing protein n=1 Tax=Coccomyxa viridis TaxID=1274662 RepID=A0AAV1HR70_9CHLO|nr:hypothetical protein CVIRNUC_000365 [Coccomyxa viridis]
MDRWGDGDGLDRGPRAPMTGVSKMGMGAFVKSSEGAASAPQDGQAAKIEVVASRREQKRAQMPPPQPLQPARPTQGPPPPGAYKAPDWAGQPPRPARLDVLKDGQVIHSIPLQQPATLFGRSPAADVVLDHPSLSRQHAVVCYNKLSREWAVLDLNSAHGTEADGISAGKGDPVPLREGSMLHFAASSREYVLRLQGALESEPQHDSAAANAAAEPPAKRRKGVQWPDEAAQQSGQQLEKVIGYTDGGSFASRIGPQAVNSSRAGGGRFADLVQSRVIAAKESVGQQQDEHLRAADVEGAQQEGHQQRPPAKRKQGEEGLRRHIAQPFLKQSMYDFLPPPSQSSAQPS